MDYDQGNQKSIKPKFLCRFESLCNVHKPIFTLIPWGNPKLLGQKHPNFSLGQKFLAAEFFPLHRYFIETTTTEIDMLLQVKLQFYNNHGNVATSGVIMLFCPPQDDWIVCRIGMVRQVTWSYSTWFSKCPIRYAYNVSTSWCSQVLLYTVVIYVLTNIITKVKQPNILKFRSIECMNMLNWVNLNT